ncbi:hypothetical protein I6U48_01145 [Clostridium sp. PL3]|uniref:ParB/Sulfiredoxin domain-containing protein n=1 Tax=Clostridium thailandense TaxID=2794346 RepID=A0A949TEX2_9CLOT|nr:hypothetical protein [Clostridium thailandense]MBV7271524.1 hypothetical protein [Clostridium thailandense]
MATKNELIGNYFCNKYALNGEEEVYIEWVNAQQLLVADRIDLMAKYYYVWCKERDYDMTWPKELYEEHIKAFSQGTFSEPGNPEKRTLESYIETFDNLISSIREKGVSSDVSAIPVNASGVIMDGAHRVAIAAALNMQVPVVRVNCEYPPNNYRLFNNRFLEEKYLDFMIYLFIILHADSHLICMWPKAIGANKEKITEAETIINNEFTVVYSKKIDVTYNGLRNIMVQTYCGFDWMGGLENNYTGATSKADECYDVDKPICIYVIQDSNLNHIIKVKEKIREIFGMGKHSLHINDTHEETVMLAQIFLNYNTLEFINNTVPDRNVELNKKIFLYKSKLINNLLNFEEFVIDSSAVIALYNLRDANDIDYITCSQDIKKVESLLGESHVNYLKYYQMTATNIIYNPECYFYYFGLKFIIISLVKKMKENRGEEKDKLDVILINGLKKNVSPNQRVKKIFLTYKLTFRRTYHRNRENLRNWMINNGSLEGYHKIRKLIRRE